MSIKLTNEEKLFLKRISLILKDNEEYGDQAYDEISELDMSTPRAINIIVKLIQNNKL